LNFFQGSALPDEPGHFQRLAPWADGTATIESRPRKIG